jgi:hypothetical protein
MVRRRECKRESGKTNSLERKIEDMKTQLFPARTAALSSGFSPGGGTPTAIAPAAVAARTSSTVSPINNALVEERGGKRVRDGPAH